MSATSTPKGFYRVELNYNEWIVPERYQDLIPIGHGSYGSVCSAYDSLTDRKVAIKKLAWPVQNVFRARHTLRELSILRHMTHENVIDLIDLFTPDTSAESLKEIFIVSTLMDADLYTILRIQELSEQHVCFLIYQIIRALKYIHSAGIIHRDLKPNNVAVNECCELKVLDFGMARPMNRKMSGYVAMRWYRAPEIMYNWTHYNQTADMWSVGCIMGELITRRPLFPGRDQIDQFWKISSVLGSPDPSLLEKMKSVSARAYIRSFPSFETVEFDTEFADLSPDAKDLLRKMLLWDPDQRITAEDALEHPFFKDFHDPTDEPTTIPLQMPFDDVLNDTLDDWRQMIWEQIELHQRQNTDDSSSVDSDMSQALTVKTEIELHRKCQNFHNSDQQISDVVSEAESSVKLEHAKWENSHFGVFKRVAQNAARSVNSEIEKIKEARHNNCICR